MTAITDSFKLKARTAALNLHGVSIVFKRFRDSHQNLKTGDVGATFDEIAIDKAFVSGLDKTAQGSVRMFRFLASNLEKEPTKRDVVSYQDADYMIVDVKTDQHKLVYSLTTETAVMGKMQYTDPSEKFRKAASRRGGAVAAQFAKKVMEFAPVENGHIHEAMLQAVSKSRINEDFEAAIGLQTQFGALRSRDPEAAKRGNGARSRGNKKYKVRFVLSLPFAAKLDHGGTIRVGDLYGRKGQKIGGHTFPGPLYGPRLASGRGVLMWRQGGQLMRARARTVPAYNFWMKAAYASRVLAAHLGLKER